MDQRPITNEESIIQYIHCRECLESMPIGESPRTWTNYEVGFTLLGVQVWCKRHKKNVMHIDFQGQKHPANTTAIRS